MNQLESHIYLQLNWKKTLFLVLPLYTNKLYFKSNSQDVIEVQTFSFNSRGFYKNLTLNVHIDTFFLHSSPFSEAQK